MKAEAKTAKQVVAEATACKSASNLTRLEGMIVLYGTLIENAAQVPEAQSKLKEDLVGFILERLKTPMCKKFASKNEKKEVRGAQLRPRELRSPFRSRSKP